MNDVLFGVLEIVVIVGALITARYVIPYFRLKLVGIVDNTLLEEVIKAVKSVEQDIRFTLGIEKKEEVMVRITAWAYKHGIKITQDQLSQLIETAVWIMKYQDQIGGSN